MSELFSLKGKAVVITGGSGYLGSAVVRELLAHGAKVAVADLVPLDITGAGEDLISIKCDMACTDSIRDMYAEVKRVFGQIDVLINCATYGAGYGPAGTVDKMSDADWEKGIDGTAGVAFRCTREIIPYFEEAGGGNIVHYSSMYGMISPDPSIYGTSGQNNPCNYGSGKAAVLQFARYCAGHLAGKNIRVNCVTPGAYPNPEKMPPEDFIRNLENKIMMKRVGKPEEIVGATIFLASDASRYMTGANIVVDGGWSAW